MKFKTIRKLLLSLIIIIFISSNSKGQYCTSTASNGDFEYISKVRIGTIENESGSNLYSDYSASLSTNLYIGESYSLTITTEQYYVVDNIACWIDWNQNEIFDPSESVSLNISGTPSEQATATATVVPPSDAVIGSTRMRIILVSDETINSCLNFTYGEVEDYGINVIGVDAPPVSSFSANKTVIYTGESVEFADQSTLVPTSWNWIVSPSTVTFIEGTDSHSQNPVITFNESGNYSITLEATNEIGTDDTLITDYIQVKDFGKPRNVNVASEGKHVNLQWDAPNISGLYCHVIADDAGYVINPGPQRATKYSAKDFSFSYPVTLTQVSAFFYQSENETWDDASFKFIVYASDTSTVLYESSVLEAEHNKEFIHNLATPLSIDQDFYLAVIPVSTSNNPANLGKLVAPNTTRTYVGEPGSWWQFSDETAAFEMTTSIYIAGDKSSDKKYSYNTDIDQDNSVSKEQIVFTLSGYEIYRNGILIKQISNKDEKEYIDRELTNDDYDYYIRAVYEPFGTSPSSDTVSVTVDNSAAEIMLIYNDQEILNKSEISMGNNVMIGSTKEMIFGIYNEGQADLSVSDISIDHEEFQITEFTSGNIAADDTTYFKVVFSPVTDGTKVANVTISNNDSNENPYSFKINAVGGLDKWTWMIYLLEDNTGLNGAKDINEWEVNGSIEGQVNFLVLYDSDNDSKDGIWYIKKDEEGFNYEFVSEKISTQFGIDPDLSDPAILEEFLLWVKDNYPAQHYGLTMWDHGSGIFKNSKKADYGIQRDFVGDMKLWEMSDAVQSFVTASEQKIDVIGFDVCLLGQFETVYQFRDLAKYVIASELTEPGDGWNYWAAFEPMVNNPNITPEEIAISITDTYIESYQPGGWQNRQASTQAATSVEKMNNEFMPVFNEFCEQLANLCYDYKPQISDARYSSWAAISVASGAEQNADHRDLGGFLKHISEDETLPAIITELAHSALMEYETMVVAEGHTESLTNGATGLKIWMPETMSTEGYNNIYYNDPENYLDISLTKWDEFLQKFENPTNSNSPVAEFSVKDTVEKGMAVKLINKSYYGPLSFSWNITPSTYEFVNGTNASSRTPEIKFTNTGKYSIALTVSNSFGSDNENQNECVVVVEPELISPTNLTYTQDENIINLNWDFVIGLDGLEEGFENTSFPPAGWSIMSNNNLNGTGLEDVADGANTWGWCDENTFTDQSGNPDPQYIHTGDYSAAIGYTAGSTGDPFNWLITPEVTISSNQDLSFWLWYASDESYYTDFDVMILSDDNWTSLLHLTDGSGVNLYDEQVIISLSEYIGKQVKIAFVYQYTDGYQLAIDDIKVGEAETKSTDHKIKNMSVPNRIGYLKAVEYSQSNNKSGYTPSQVNVYRNGEMIGAVTDLAKNQYVDTLLTNGTYTYHVKMQYSQPEGESDASNSVDVTVSSITGMDDLNEQYLDIYPNPTNDYIHITYPSEFTGGIIQIIDLSGKVVLYQTADLQNPKVNLKNITNGMYIIKLTGRKNNYINRLIKK